LINLEGGKEEKLVKELVRKGLSPADEMRNIRFVGTYFKGWGGYM